MKKLVKLLLVAAPVLALTACGSSNKTADGAFGGYSAEDLQQRNNTVYFAFDKYDLDAQNQELLDAHAQYLVAKPNVNVSVQGHTDERGTPEYNIALGERRANAVTNYLVNKGVASKQLSKVSYGEEKPAVLGHTEADYVKNRRAVLVY